MSKFTRSDWDAARWIQRKSQPHSGNQETKADTCPKHGEPYVIQPGRNRCPKGKKQQRNCR